jgi:hypothetical protein
MFAHSLAAGLLPAAKTRQHQAWVRVEKSELGWTCSLEESGEPRDNAGFSWVPAATAVFQSRYDSANVNKIEGTTKEDYYQYDSKNRQQK